MGSVVLFIARRIFGNQARKIRLIGRVITIIGIARFVTKFTAPSRRVVLAPNETMEIRITKTEKRTS